MKRTLLMIIALGVMLNGCLLVVDSDEHSRVDRWSQAEADRIRTGETQAGWIRDSFGAPDRVTTYEDGTELWRYRNERTRNSEISLFLLFDIDVERDRSDVLTLEISDGVVTDYWIESR